MRTPARQHHFQSSKWECSRGILRHISHAPGERLPVNPAERDTIEENFTFLGLKQAGEQSNQSGFTAPIRAYDRPHAASFQTERCRDHDWSFPHITESHIPGFDQTQFLLS